jgi:hypothetical protein
MKATDSANSQVIVKIVKPSAVYHFEVGNNKYLISERKQTSPKKPPLFIRRIEPTFEYVSGLFPVGGNRYSGDYRNHCFIIEISPEGEIISVDQFARLVGQIEGNKGVSIRASDYQNIQEPVQK